MHNVFLSAINAWTRVPACRAVPTPCARWCSTRPCAGARRATRGTPGSAACGTRVSRTPAGRTPTAAPRTASRCAPAWLATWALPHIADSQLRQQLQQQQQLLLLPRQQQQLQPPPQPSQPPQKLLQALQQLLQLQPPPQQLPQLRPHLTVLNKVPYSTYVLFIIYTWHSWQF